MLPPDSQLPLAGRAEFLEGMSRVTQAVSVVTTDGPAGRDGLAVTAMSPVSADTPRPTLLICLKASSRAAPVIVANGRFCLNLLAEDQLDLSEAFAGRRGRMVADWFAMASWSQLRTRSPALDGALVNFDCEIISITDIGTHHLIIGGVQAVRTAPGKPLAHVNRAYASILNDRSSP